MENNLSANTLFHFTASKSNLTGILKNGLFIRYSLENYESLINKKAEIAVPMACFCDIPLSQIKNHISKYGKYAIGLTKDWGMKNEVSPVIYAYPKSTTSEILNEITDKLSQFFDIEDKSTVAKEKRTLAEIIMAPETQLKIQLQKHVLELEEQLGHFIRFIKPYEGKLYRDGKYLEKVIKYYDEREWRYVPPKKLLKQIEVKDSYKAEFHRDPRKRRYINIKLAKHKKLIFTPKDIRFIIVEKEKEIPEMVNAIRDIFSESIPAKELEILTTRLISIDQIMEDL